MAKACPLLHIALIMVQDGLQAHGILPLSLLFVPALGFHGILLDIGVEQFTSLCDEEGIQAERVNELGLEHLCALSGALTRASRGLAVLLSAQGLALGLGEVGALFATTALRAGSGSRD